MADIKTCIVWLRKDLRLTDQPSFEYAIEKGYAILPLFIWDSEEHSWAEGAASQWWLHHALIDLDEQLCELGTKLILIKAYGDTEKKLLELVSEIQPDAVFWGRRYEPEIIARDSHIKKVLRDLAIDVKSFNTHLLFEPHSIKNLSGSYYKVFTPYWNCCRELEVKPLSDPDWESVRWVKPEFDCISISDLRLLPARNWDSEFYLNWCPTRQGAEKRLALMTAGKASVYEKNRDTPSIDGTSQLSPWLQWGQISPKEIYLTLSKPNDEQVERGYLRQLFWREFSYHLLFHAPHSTERALRPEYERFLWKPNPDFLKAWQRGQTGYPIVDAGMRQLWRTGWMHNRVRMIVSSFLVKHLLQDWRSGASWFWNTLLDADLANNTMGWQWIAGSGADASPYFRIFNPISQGEKFDKAGDYVREYCPELAHIPPKYIHQPWAMPELELLASGVKLGVDYPEPIISHAEGRRSALDAYAKFKETS